MPPDRETTTVRTVVCVTGMHRSGTSMLAGALPALGVSLGNPERLMGPGPDNQAGYHEIRAVKELNDELLAHLGGAWDEPPVLDPGWEHAPGLDAFRTRAAAALEQAFGPRDRRAPLLAFKDPRLALLVPFWRAVTPIATTIVLVRDPDEVAASLAARRYAVPTGQAASLWLRYLFAARINDPHGLVVSHDDCFRDLPGVLRTVAHHLGLPAPDPEVLAAAGAGLDRSLRHHIASRRDAEDHPLLRIARAVWHGGDIDLAAVPAPIADAIALGWLGPPLDRELLARARAEAITLREQLRRRHREDLAQAAASRPSGQD